MDAQVTLLDQLFDAGLLIDTGVDGLYGRSGLFEDVIDALRRADHAASAAPTAPR